MKLALETYGPCCNTVGFKVCCDAAGDTLSARSFMHSLSRLGDAAQPKRAPHPISPHNTTASHCLSTKQMHQHATPCDDSLPMNTRPQTAQTTPPPITLQRHTCIVHTLNPHSCNATPRANAASAHRHTRKLTHQQQQQQQGRHSQAIAPSAPTVTAFHSTSSSSSSL